MTLADEFPSILAAARAGADWAWARIYHDLASTILGYLRTRGARDPEDVLGEVFLQVVRDLDRFDGDEAGFRSWVFTIVHRRLIDEGRRNARRPVHFVDEEELDAALPAVTTEEDVLANLGADDLARLLSVLTEEQRAALALRFVAGMELPEVAEVMGRTANATKALQRRGLRALRRHLEARRGKSS